MSYAMQLSKALEGFSKVWNDQADSVTCDSRLEPSKALSALATAQVGTLSTRTDDDTGVATLSTGHGIQEADVVDVYWSGGVRYGMTASVSSDDITVDGGAGDNLPVQSTAITVVTQTNMEINFDGDDARVFGLVYDNPSDTSANAHIDLQDTGGNTIKEADLVHITANGGLTNVWVIANGDTNVITGNRITQAKISHDSTTSTGTIYVLIGYNS